MRRGKPEVVDRRRVPDGLSGAKRVSKVEAGSLGAPLRVHLVSASGVGLLLVMAPFLLAPAQARQLPNECRAKTAEAQDRILHAVRSVELQESDTAPIASTTSIALGTHGLIALLDRRDYNVKLFNPAGRLLRVIGRRGQGPGELSGPAVVGLDGDSLVLVADERRARLVVYDTAGSLRGEWAVPARPIGGLLVHGSAVAIGGLNGFAGPARTAHLAMVSDLAVSDDPEPIGLLPESYSRFPAILTSPVLLAPASGGGMYATWRFSNEVVRLAPDGTAGPVVALPNHRGFVDPRQIFQKDLPPQELMPLTTPILSLYASDGLIYVGYLSPGAGSRPLRFHVLDSALRVLATDIRLSVFGTVGDTVISLRGNEDPEGQLHYTLTWNVRCRRLIR